MWVSKKKWLEMNKRIADLEDELQNQQSFLIKHLKNHEKENNDFFKAIKEIKELMKTDITEHLSQ